MRALTLALVLPLLVAPSLGGAVTIQDFDSPGTNWAGENFPPSPGHGNTAPLPAVLAGGPTGDFLQLKDFTRNSFTAAGFDRTDVGPHGRITGEFDFRITCLGSRIGFTGGGCADGFSMILMDTGVFGDTGAPGIQIEEAGRTGLGGTSNSFGVGFGVFDSGGGIGPRNRVFLSFNDVLFASQLIDLNVLDLATGINQNRGGFLTASFDLLLEGTPSITVQVSDGVTTVAPFLNFDLSGVTGLAPYEARVGFGVRSGDAGLAVDLDNINVRFQAASAVPEPASLVLVALGLAGLASIRRQSRQATDRVSRREQG